MGLIPHDSCPHKRGQLDTEIYTGQCGDGARHWGGVPTSQGMPEIIRKPPESERQTWNKPSLTAARKHQTCQHLDLGFLDFRAVRKVNFC